MNLIVLAGGQGTRFYPVTKHIPKALVRVQGRPLIEHVLQSFDGLVSKIIVVVNDETGELLRSYLGTSYGNSTIEYVVQPLAGPRGTWAALQQASALLDRDDYFMVINCDDIFNRDEIIKIVSMRPEVAMGISKAVMPKKYLGIMVNNEYVSNFRSNQGSESELVEDLFCNGLYILSPNVLQLHPVEIADGEFGLPQTLFANLKTIPCLAIEMDYWVSINKPDDIKKLDI